VSRYLFVVPPLVGHINPAVGVAAALAARGHQVAWVGHAGLIARLAGPETTVLRRREPEYGRLATERPSELRGPAALKFLWEDFLIPLADAMTPQIQAAVEDFSPDALVVDQQAVAGAVVAMRCGIPWASSATTAAELSDPLRSMPKVAAWVRGLLLDLEVRNGLPTTPASQRYQRKYGDLRFSPRLVIVYSTAALSGGVDELHGIVRFVGPSITKRPGDEAFPWDRLPQGRPIVLATVGTVNSKAGASLLALCVDAIAASPHVFGIVVDPNGVITAKPPNVMSAPHVPQLEVLRRADSAICHAGQNTVCEALYHGVPLVMAPIRDDQPIVAQQVTAAGAGLRLRFAHSTADDVRTALDRVLTEPAFGQAARSIARSFHEAGGADAAATHLERLLSAQPTETCEQGR
jgi:MGT family glycosyltransferase